MSKQRTVEPHLQSVSSVSRQYSKSPTKSCSNALLDQIVKWLQREAEEGNLSYILMPSNLSSQLIIVGMNGDNFIFAVGGNKDLRPHQIHELNWHGHMERVLTYHQFIYFVEIKRRGKKGGLLHRYEAQTRNYHQGFYGIWDHKIEDWVSDMEFGYFRDAQNKANELNGNT